MTEAAGLGFQHTSGAEGRYYYPEIMGSGGALLDYDADGDLDLYIVQGDTIGAGAPRARDRLYRNDWDGESVKFVDVTEAANLPVGGVGMGVAVGDVDNDGWEDLFVTNYGSNRLLRNRGDGSFDDFSAASGLDESRWSVAAAFVDFDQDGWEDLFVANYVDFAPPRQIPCYGNTGARDYCGPDTYPALRDRLYRNRGDGTFEDFTARAGLAGVADPSLGVVVRDFNDDGWPDLYVAVDRGLNRLWMNQQNGAFLDEALIRGCAVNVDGKAEASMGIAAADIDGDGDEDLFVTHLERETNTLYRNDGQGGFVDDTTASGLGAVSWKMTGFGTQWLDYDRDGDLDLVVVNGAVTSIQDLLQKEDPYPFHQPNQLFEQVAGGGFREITAAESEGLIRSEVSRGALTGDLDNDGDADLVITNNNGPARVLINSFSGGNSWFGLSAVAENRVSEGGGLNARVRGENRDYYARPHRSSGYASSVDPRVLLGLGAGEAPITVEIWSPSGRSPLRWNGMLRNRYSRWVPPPTG